MISQKFRKYYIQGSTLSFEEDKMHEFKGHLNLSKEDIPIWAQEHSSEKASRKPISRNLNAFLNSGLGGTVYLGVLDSGTVHGIRMTRLQRDHFLQSLDDLMSRYKPVVLPHQYSVRFTPVVDRNSTQDDILSFLEHISKEETIEADKKRVHVFRTSYYCWCDKDAAALYNNGISSSSFVIEVVIKSWNNHDPHSPSIGEDEYVKFQQYYKNEEDKVFFRKQASVVQYTLGDLVRITRSEVKKRYEEEIIRVGRSESPRTQPTNISSTPAAHIESCISGLTGLGTNPEYWGWQIDDKQMWKPLWTTLAEAETSCYELIQAKLPWSTLTKQFEELQRKKDVRNSAKIYK